MKFIAIGLAVVLVSGIGVGTYIFYDFSSTVSANAVDLDGQEDVPPDIGEYKGGFNLVLTGVDTCEEKYKDLFGDRCTGRDAGHAQRCEPAGPRLAGTPADHGGQLPA